MPEHPRGDEQGCRGARRLQSAHRADAAQRWMICRLGEHVELGRGGGRLVSLKARPGRVPGRLEARQAVRINVLPVAQTETKAAL